MNKKLNIVALMTALVIGIAIIAVAAGVYDRATGTLGTSTGTGVWTNNVKYAALELKRVWIYADLVAVDTVTVQRVCADLSTTQTVGTVTTAANAGSTASFTAGFLKPSDLLLFTSGNSTGASYMIEYEVQRP